MRASDELTFGRERDEVLRPSRADGRGSQGAQMMRSLRESSSNALASASVTPASMRSERRPMRAAREERDEKRRHVVEVREHDVARDLHPRRARRCASCSARRDQLGIRQRGLDPSTMAGRVSPSATLEMKSHSISVDHQGAMLPIRALSQRGAWCALATSSNFQACASVSA